MGESSEVTGTVTQLTGLPSDEGERLYMLVTLANGEQVRTFITNSSFYRQGQKVRLQKQEPMFFGRTVYRFWGYIEDKGT